jgi:hypothetical protein
MAHTEAASLAKGVFTIMGRFLTATVVAASVLAAVLAGQQPVFRGSGDVVRVFSTVTDRDGKLVTTLGRDSFEVRDEGKPQPITQFDNTPQPVRLIVMLDVSGSMEGTCSCCARPPTSSSSGCARTTWRASAASATTWTSAPASRTRSASCARRCRDRLRRRAHAAVARGGRGHHRLRVEKDMRSVVLVLSDGKDSGPISFRQRYISQAK